jgi:hypothetical protein
MRTRLRIGGARSGGTGDRFCDRVTAEARLGAAESEDEVSEVSLIVEGRRGERTLEREAAMCPRAVAGVCGRLRLSMGAVRSG